jgi:hypothetical protein
VVYGPLLAGKGQPVDIGPLDLPWRGAHLHSTPGPRRVKRAAQQPNNAIKRTALGLRETMRHWVDGISLRGVLAEPPLIAIVERLSDTLPCGDRSSQRQRVAGRCRLRIQFGNGLGERGIGDLGRRVFRIRAVEAQLLALRSFERFAGAPSLARQPEVP